MSGTRHLRLIDCATGETERAMAIEDMSGPASDQVACSFCGNPLRNGERMIEAKKSAFRICGLCARSGAMLLLSNDFDGAS